MLLFAASVFTLAATVAAASSSQSSESSRSSQSSSTTSSSTSTASSGPQTHVVNVGHNTTANATSVFQPELIIAAAGDLVIFNFTLGDHSAIQSDFGTPCIPISQTNSSVNGFNSGPRNAGNGTVITQQPFTVTSNSTPVWFYDSFTCGEGGVGAINPNESSTATLQGFVRNAIRLNGTASSNASLSSASSSEHKTATSASSSSTTSSGGGKSSGATKLDVGASLVTLLLGAAAGVALF